MKYCIKVTHKNYSILNKWLHKNNHKFKFYNNNWKVSFNPQNDNFFHFGTEELFHSSPKIYSGYKLIENFECLTMVSMYKIKYKKYTKAWNKIMGEDEITGRMHSFSINSPCEETMIRLDLKNWFEPIYFENPFKYSDNKVYFTYKNDISIPLDLLYSDISSITFNDGGTLDSNDLNQAKIWLDINS